MADEIVNTKKTAAQVTVEKIIPVSNPSGVSPMYANSLAVTGTLTDFTLHFLEIRQSLTAPGQPSSAVQELKASITLPLALAANLAELGKQTLEKQAQAMERVAKGQAKSGQK